MVEIALAPPDAREEVAQFMCASFPKAKWDITGWRALMGGRWAGAEDSCAVTLRDGGALVGVLGLVHARRPTAHGMLHTANMTSWYVNKPYRGQGLGGQMIALAARDRNVTVTNFSSAKGAVGVVRGAGMTALDTHRCLWGAGPSDLTVRTPAQVWDDLSETDKQVLTDHEGLNLTPVVIETPDGLCTLVQSIKRKHDAYVTHEALYVGDQALFARYAGQIAGAVLPAQGAKLSVDARFVGDAGQQAPAQEAFAVPRFFTPGRCDPAAVDLLYSEIVLLDMKLY